MPRQPRERRLKAIPASVAVPVVVLALGGCGGSRSTPRAAPATVPVVTTPLSQSAPAQVASPPVRPATGGAPIGATERERVGNSVLTVTVKRLFDPLSAPGAQLLPGTRAVGIAVTLANSGAGIYDSSATGDFSVLATTGPVSPLFVPSGVCQTPLDDFDRYLTDGETRSGCVAFAVPRHARVLAVRFSPHARAAGRLAWRPRG